ncbi:hypothetical protein F4860DRAFT_522783 [Xylaria cubensis]|nr:hypothetical protein F4860DRAFT_522783 [Xylaria cubensis]
MLPRWLVDPNRYTILAACGPREIAREIYDEHKRKVGALSFFLSDCMGRVNGLGARQWDVYGYLSVSMREFSSRSGRQQTPMLYGNKYLSLFGVLNPAHRSATIQIMRSASGTLQLQAGEAHGISVGDRFDVYLFKSIGEVLPVTAQVQRVKALTSDLELLGETIANAMNITNQRVSEENAFQRSFRITLTNLTNNKVYLSGSQVMAQQGDRFELTVENEEPDVLHLDVYSMDSLWKIQSKLNGDCESIPPPGYAQGVTTTGTWKRTLTMKLPQELERQGISQCEDIIKIFLTLQATTFTILELPAFGEPIKSTDPVRNSDCHDSRQSEDWAALTFRIHTSRR